MINSSTGSLADFQLKKKFLLDTSFKTVAISWIMPEMNFQTILQNAFEKRREKNKQYSLRAFARDLGVASSNLSQALKGTRGFSKEVLKHISKELNLSHEETRLFSNSCLSQFSKSKKVRMATSLELKRASLYKAKVGQNTLDSVLDWRPLSIMALMDRNDFQSDTAWISDQLGISEVMVESCIDKLILAGAVIKKDNGQWHTTGNLYIMDTKDTPIRAAQTVHKQIIEKALNSVEEQSIDDRDLTSIMMCFDKSKMAEARDRIKKFCEDFELEFGPNPQSKNQKIYGFGVYLFNLNQDASSL